jgi:hypothetical protein
MQRAQSNSCGRAPFLRVTLATALAVLAGTTLVACENKDSTDNKDTTASPAAGEQRGDRGIDQPGQYQTPTTTQRDMTQQGTAQQGTGQQGMGQQGMGHQQTTPGTLGSGSLGGEGMTAMQNQDCPMMVEGANVEVENTNDGVELRFTTTTGTNVEDLRNRVEHMRRMYERHGTGQGGSMMWQSTGHTRADQDQGGAGGQGPTGTMPPVTAKVENIDNGARLVLSTHDKSQREALREHVRDHRRRMMSGECWMEQGQMGGGQDQGRTGSDRSEDDRPGHRPGEAAPGEGGGTRPKTAP